MNVEYPCPECGHDGPHPVVDKKPDGSVIECVGCYSEVDIPPVTKDGTVLTDEVVNALADEAEAGYDPDTLIPRRRNP